MPPPPANVVTVRRISGPPIPREEPEERLARLYTPPPSAPIIVLDSSARTTALSPGAIKHRDNPPEPSPQPPPPPPAADVAPANDTIDGVPISQDLDSRALFDLLGWETGAEAPEPAPPSSAAALPPHKPPLGYAAPEELPSVIVDIDQELAAIVDRVVSGEADESAEGELLRQGERAMRVIMARFPGPVTVERERVVLTGHPARASECGPILRLVARERKVALPFVLERLSDPNPEARGWATHLLCELPYVEAVPYALERLRDPDAGIRTSAAHAVAAVAKAFPDQTRDAIRQMLAGADVSARVSAIRAIARLRLTILVGDLIESLEDPDERIATSAHDSVVHVTCQDFGSGPQPWREWWEANASRHRVEWLIDALTHDVSEIRRSAGEELRATTREYFGYSSELPPRDRERAQQRRLSRLVDHGGTRTLPAPSLKNTQRGW